MLSLSSAYEVVPPSRPSPLILWVPNHESKKFRAMRTQKKPKFGANLGVGFVAELLCSLEDILDTCIVVHSFGGHPGPEVLRAIPQLRKEREAGFSTGKSELTG
jgi:hypothetical protein